MINFNAMPPVDRKRREEAAPRITHLLNGAKFEFLEWRESDGKFWISGRYLDYAGEWCAYSWTERGQVRDEHYPKFAEMGLDWSTARK